MPQANMYAVPLLITEYLYTNEGVMYSKKLLEKALQELSSQLFLGTFITVGQTSPASGLVTPNDAAFITTSFYFQPTLPSRDLNVGEGSEQLSVRIQTLDTPSGKVLHQMMDSLNMRERIQFGLHHDILKRVKTQDVKQCIEYQSVSAMRITGVHAGFQNPSIKLGPM